MSSSSNNGNSNIFRVGTDKRNIRRDSTNEPLVESITGSSSSQSSFPRLPQHLSQDDLTNHRLYSHNRNISRGGSTSFSNSGREFSGGGDLHTRSNSNLDNRIQEKHKSCNNMRHSLDNSSFKPIKPSIQKSLPENVKKIYPVQQLSSQLMQTSTEITPDSDVSIKSDSSRISYNRNFYSKNQTIGSKNAMEMRRDHVDFKGKGIFNESSSQISNVIPSPERRRKLLKKISETNNSSYGNELVLSQDNKSASIYESASVISDSSSVLCSNTRKAMVHKIFRMAQQKEQTQVQNPLNNFDVDRSSIDKAERSPNQESAVTFARTAPKAGYLYKLGANVQTYKRRFFILKPTTHFYYFLSPNDSEPRGCIDLESSCSTIREIETLPDGRFRFEIIGNTGNVQEDTKKTDFQRIILEARNEEVGRDWIKKLKEERLSFYKTKCDDHKERNAELENKISEFEKQIENYRLVEQDRDGAIQDADQWREKFNTLNESLHLLTRQLKKAPAESEIPDPNKPEANALRSDSKLVENEIIPSKLNDENEDESQILCEKKDISPSFLNISDEELQIEDLDLSGTHFSSLNNACQMLKENLRLTSLEAIASVDEVHRTNDKILAQQNRMKKAEKLICKLWEENCALRDVAKQKKKESRFLGHQIRLLMGSNPGSINEQLPETIFPASTATTMNSTLLPNNMQKQENAISEKEHRKKMVFGLKEKMLLQELEDHVVSSLQLHEKLLNANRTGYRRKKNPTKNEIARNPTLSTNTNLTNNPIERNEQVRHKDETIDKQFYQKNQGYCREQEHHDNLFDKSESDYDGDMNESISPIKPARLTFSKNIDLDEFTTTSVTSDISNSVPGIANQVGKIKRDFCRNDDGESLDLSFNYQGSSISKETHPLFRLGQDDWTDDNCIAPNLCSSSSQSNSNASRSTIVENGKATSHLACPLADVINKQGSTLRGVGDDGMVYHLTFYCKKIGLQFQKVPNEAPSSGLLKEALTTDNPNDSNGSKYLGRTASELNTISMISNRTNDPEMECPVATPVDAVLVCGFYGFDAASNQRRPKLGARLVAFDGVSVEIGKWTFEGIRKAIQARGRPITLSFRNDYLTPKQRGILTKAINDVGSHPPLPPPSQSHARYNATTSNKNVVSNNKINDVKNLNVRTMHGSSPESFSSMSESHDLRHSGLSVTPASKTDLISPQTWQSERSFSDTGSSSIISSAFGPLVAGLMAGRVSADKSNDVPCKPNYLQHVSNSLDDIVEHQDFKASLL